MIKLSIKEIMIKIIPIIILISCLIVFYLTNDILNMFFTMLILVFFIFIITIKRDLSNIVFSFFILSFFTFLVARMLVVTIFKYSPTYTSLLGTAFSNEETVKRVLLILSISFISLYFGYSVKLTTPKSKSIKKISNSYLISIMQASKILFYCSFFFRIMVLFQMIKSTHIYGYYETFATFQSSLPGIFILFSEMYDIALFIFLSCRPTKKECTFLIYLYLFDGLLSLISGRRVEFLLNLIVVVIYIAYRHFTNKNEKWLNKRIVFSLLIVAPIILGLLNVVGEVRGGGSSQTSNFNEGINKFFFSQGISVNIIGYTIDFFDSLPKQNYSFGPIIEFFKTKVLNVFIHSNFSPVGQTVQRAMEGNLYSHTISYYIMPDLYLRGIGYGSSYIAELYKDFSYSGIIIGNFFYGFMFRNFFLYVNKNGPYIGGLLFLMIRQIMFAPRSSFTNFLVNSISIPKILAIIIIFCMAQIIMRISKKGSEVTFD